jgi:succinate dehydrogenase/fumarate reductase flavoprotein subunit
MAGRVEVLVAGSGAAGLTAALVCAANGRRTLVCDASADLGGTSALSGGRVWVPGNHFQRQPRADRQAAAGYLAGIFDPGQRRMSDAFLDAAPAMVRFVEGHTAHRFAPCPDYPDYHPHRPGATLGGRCLDARPLSLDGLHPLVDRVLMPHGYLPMTHAEWAAWRFPPRFDWDLLGRRAAERVVTSGVALVCALLDGVLRAGGQIAAGHRLVDLSASGHGGFRGTLALADGGRGTVDAGTVVLATGGYDQDPARRRRYLPAAVAASGSAPSNVGDALDICARLGAPLTNLGQGWWMPMLAGEETDGIPAYRALIRERGAPRQIVVDRSGYRFVDEAVPYHEFCKAMHETDSAEAYLILDEGYRRRYALPGVAPDQPVPGWVATAASPAGLATVLGVDPAGLADQVRHWNAACARGVDDQFGRGANAYDRYYGDPSLAGNPNLGPLDEPPYYGMRLLAGTIGSKGGPVTDADGRVLDAAHRPIPGLFAVGNAAASWTADGYPGPGATLGIGMAMAFRAGRAIAAGAPALVPARTSTPQHVD